MSIWASCHVMPVWTSNVYQRTAYCCVEEKCCYQIHCTDLSMGSSEELEAVGSVNSQLFSLFSLLSLRLNCDEFCCSTSSFFKYVSWDAYSNHWSMSPQTTNVHRLWSMLNYYSQAICWCLINKWSIYTSFGTHNISILQICVVNPFFFPIWDTVVAKSS